MTQEKEPFRAVMFEQVDVVLLLKVALPLPICRREKSVRSERALRRRHFQYRGSDPDRRESKEPNIFSFEPGSDFFYFFNKLSEVDFFFFDEDDWIFLFFKSNSRLR